MLLSWVRKKALSGAVGCTQEWTQEIQQCSGISALITGAGAGNENASRINQQRNINLNSLLKINKVWALIFHVLLLIIQHHGWIESIWKGQRETAETVLPGLVGQIELLTCDSMLVARGWTTSWTGSEADVGGPFLFWCPRPGGRGITPVADAGYKPWPSGSWYNAAWRASASFFPTTNLGNGRSLTVETEIHWEDLRGSCRLYLFKN